MDITVRGWGRDMGEKNLCSYSLSELSISDKGTVYRGEPPTLTSGYNVRVSWHQELRLTGSYLMTVQFSKWDVIKLFKAAFGGTLNADLINKYGFTVSPELAKAILRTIKLSDVTLADLAAMNTLSSEKPATAEKLVEAEVRQFLRRV